MEKNSPYNLFRMFILSFWTEILSLFVVEPTPEFPEKIGNYSFVRNFEKIGARKSYLLAIYANQKGDKAIAKMRSSKIKGYHFNSLLNEINLYKILNSTVERLKADIPDEYRNLYIPKLIATQKDGKKLISLVEYVEGDNVDNLSAKEKVKLYLKIADFFKFLGELITPEERSKISVRKSINYIALYPFLAIKAIITYPFSFKYVLLGTLSFIRNIPIILKLSEISLIHRDLHFKNILRTRNKFVLIDFQQMVYSEPLHEFITTLRYFWSGQHGREFIELLMKEMVKKHGKRESFDKLFESYAINSVTHGLTGSGFPRETVNGWVDFLKFSLTADLRKYKSNF